MKNLSLVLHGLWAIATGVLFYLVLSRPSAEPTVLPAAAPGQVLPNIYYVDFDSLSSKATYIKQLREESEARQRGISRDLDRRVSQFQQEVAAYQQKGASMTAIQRELTEQDLGKKQQEIVQYREQVADRLAREEADRAEAMMNKIREFLRKQEGLGNIAYVLAYQKSANILLANDSLDITQRVIEGLNAQHAAEKDKAKQK